MAIPLILNPQPRAATRSSLVTWDHTWLHAPFLAQHHWHCRNFNARLTEWLQNGSKWGMNKGTLAILGWQSSVYTCSFQPVRRNMLEGPSPTIFTSSMRKMSISPPELGIEMPRKTWWNLALQTVAFDRSIGTSIVAVASTFKRHSMLRWKNPEHKRFDDKLETGKEWRFGIEVKWKGGHRLFWQGCTSPTYRPRPWESISAKLRSKNTLSKWRPYAKIPMLWFQFGGTIGMSSLRDTTSNRWSESQPSVAWLQSSPWWPW